MFSRAMELYNTHKERKGFNQKHIFKPEKLAHFHIEAFGDNIEHKNYQGKIQVNEIQISDVVSGGDATPIGAQR